MLDGCGCANERIIEASGENEIFRFSSLQVQSTIVALPCQRFVLYKKIIW